MLKIRKQGLIRGGAGRLTIALAFLACAGLSALAHADTRSVEGFDIDRVVLRGSDELKIVFNDANRLLVKGDSEDLDKEPFYVRGSTLKLGYTSNGRKVRNVKYLLEVEDLDQIVLQGSGDIWVDPVETDRLSVSVDGSGVIRLHSVIAGELEVSVAGSGTIQLASSEVEDLEVELAGSGDIDLGRITARRMNVDMAGSGDVVGTSESEDGMVDVLDISIAGSGDVDLASMPAGQVDVDILGSGDVRVWAVDFLDANILGSGDVEYRGDPRVDRSTLGSGSVTSID
ncbi:MAG: DUF2807 domain-containing protein [Halieaceae bacterium]|nr:DUF2807 domain-containing protein [Halieaceae bacterium]